MTEQTYYPDWQKLTPLPKAPRPDEKAGAKFVVVDEEYHSYFKLGDIVELAKNDGTRAQYFKRINGDRIRASAWYRLAPLPQPEEKKVKKLVPFTDEFDWCEEGVLVFIDGYGERYAVRAKGGQVWAVVYGKKLCEIGNSIMITTHSRSECQKVIHESHRRLTNREFAEFMQDYKGMVKYTSIDMIYCNFRNYKCENENEAVHDTFLFRFRGTEEWHPVTTELYEIAKEVNA